MTNSYKDSNGVLVTYNDRWKNFSDDELRCKCGCNQLNPNEKFIDLMDKLQELRNQYGKPLKISSAYRCSEHPIEKAKTCKPGQHNIAAVDILCWGADALDILELALDLDFTGIGINQKGDYTKRFIHLDLRENQALWSY